MTSTKSSRGFAADDPKWAEAGHLPKHKTFHSPLRRVQTINFNENGFEARGEDKGGQQEGSEMDWHVPFQVRSVI